MAIGVLREAFEIGVRIPDELSVVGFDNIKLSEFVTPPLTTVELSQTDLARIAFRALMKATAQQSESDRELSTS